MCGIGAVIGFDVSEAGLHNINAALHHRGPDGSGVYVSKAHQVGLSHTRLAIVDIDGGAQPLKDLANETVLVCNGEIYDYEELRAGLQSEGYQFKTNSDSEVILHLYAKYGENLFAHLRGEFAFILYDARRGIVIAGRDRFGIKPLKIYQDGLRFVMASEAKGIFATGLVTPAIDPIALRDHFSYVLPDSIFVGINSVPSGHYLKIDLNAQKSSWHQYWRITNMSETEDLETCTERIKDNFLDAVQARLRADVPVGVYLSGGIDSAAITGAAAMLSPHQRIKAFNISFCESSQYDEGDAATSMAKKAGVDLYQLNVTTPMLVDNLEDCLWYSELPTANYHGVAKFLLSRLARQHVKVVLSGEGSDEVFLGYEYFKDPALEFTAQAYSKRPRRLRAKTGKHVTLIERTVGFIPQAEMRTVFSQRIQGVFRRLFHRHHHAALEATHPVERLAQRVKADDIAGFDSVKKVQYYSIKGILEPYILTVLGDHQEMAHSLEGRTPFLDCRLVDAAFRTPAKFKIHGDEEKFVLREAVRPLVTDEIYRKRKKPFIAPPVWVDKSQSPNMERLINTYLAKDAIRRAGIFNVAAVRRLQWLLRLIFFNCDLKQGINGLLQQVLAVQILHRKYIADFPAAVAHYQKQAQARNAGDGNVGFSEE